MEKKWIDITQPLTKNIAVWPGDTPYQFELSYTKKQTGSVNIGQFTSSVHTGTHVDAPFHFDNDGEQIHQIDPNIYIGPAKIIDVTEHKIIDRSILETFDLRGVKRLLLKTEKERDPTSFPREFSILDPDVGAYLKALGIFLIGTDAPSVDPVDSKSVSAHHALNKNGVYILENLLLNKVESGYYELIALPLKLVGADGSPVRAVIRPID